MNCQTSKYVLFAKGPDNSLLYNSANGAIVSIPSVQIIGDRQITCSESERNELALLGFFDNENTVLKQFLELRKELSDTLIITISITQGCNFKCVYCSQNDSKDNPIISEEIIDSIVLYIKNCFEEHKNYKMLAVDFFGGEPLLGKDRILYFKKEVEKILNPEQISYAIDTNGYLLDKTFVSNFEQLYINLTLSEKSDHDSKRVLFSGEGTFEKIVNNLKNISDWFDGDKRALRLRYNVGRDRSGFKTYIRFIKSNFPFVEYIEIAPIIDFKYNEYKENLNYTDFSRWYIEEAVDILAENDLIIEFPNPNYSKCRAYSMHDIKVFPDGKLATCSTYKYNDRKSDIRDICHKINSLGAYFETKKNDCLDEECLDCDKIFLCGGKLFCKNGNPCCFLNYDLESFLLKYMMYIDTEKESLFATIN